MGGKGGDGGDGARGATGETGAAGTTGDKGRTGATGGEGERGATGSRGKSGVAGVSLRAALVGYLILLAFVGIGFLRTEQVANDKRDALAIQAETTDQAIREATVEGCRRQNDLRAAVRALNHQDIENLRPVDCGAAYPRVP